MQRTIIGVEFSASSGRVCCAQGSFADGRTAVTEIEECSGGEDTAAVVAEWIRSSPHRALIALDAPLGWPAALGTMMSEHRAGQALEGRPEELFRRRTDHFVGALMGEHPLGVGVDRIAAYAALAFLEDLRTSSESAIPLAWSRDADAAAAIEVFPAATLKAHRVDARGYRSAAETDLRFNLVVALRDRIRLPGDVGMLVGDPDVLDAAVCVLAAHDFLVGSACEPEEDGLARTEGWIWVRDPDARHAA
jgi:hypothetical protein